MDDYKYDQHNMRLLKVVTLLNTPYPFWSSLRQSCQNVSWYYFSAEHRIRSQLPYLVTDSQDKSFKTPNQLRLFDDTKKPTYPLAELNRLSNT